MMSDVSYVTWTFPFPSLQMQSKNSASVVVAGDLDPAGSESDHEDEYQELGVGHRHESAGVAGRLGNDDDDDMAQVDDEDEEDEDDNLKVPPLHAGDGGGLVDAAMSDLEYLRSRMSSKWDESEEDDEEPRGEGSATYFTWKDMI